MLRRNSPGSVRAKSRGASAIKCWRTSRKPLTWYSLRLNSRLAVLLWSGSRYYGESQLFQRAMPHVGRSLCRQNYPLRILQDQVRRTSSIPMPGVREDFLHQHRDPYPRIQHRRATFDEVAALSVEGLNKSAIARREIFSSANCTSLETVRCLSL